MQTKILKHKSLQSGIIFISAMLLVIMSTSGVDAAFDSGSTCVNPASTDCLGAFSPTVNTVIDLPPDGVLDYTTFTVPAGVTVTFKKNAVNTPVAIRTTGDVIIEGTLSLSGTAAKHSGAAGDGNIGDDGQPGLGGPGGYDGGFGAASPLFGGSTGATGGGGQGPGGGQAGGSYPESPSYGQGMGGGGGGFGTAGGAGGSYWWGGPYGGAAGPTYGQSNLLPLVGGSGGGGGGSGSNYNGGGGGGGGGAILIASSGSITVRGNGMIISDGGAGGSNGGDNDGGGGGGGTGGAIRLLAETVIRTDNGQLLARGGGGGNSSRYWSFGGAGGTGIIRIEANNIQWSGGADPVYTVGTPGNLFVPNNPTLSITHVAGNPVPPNPTGSADITLPEGTAMPVTVNIAATNIPRGTTVTVYVVPASGGTRTSVLSTALDGASDAATTATAEVTLGNGNNALLAAATFTVTELASLYLPTFEGERVANIRVESALNGGSQMVYITASGKEYPSLIVKK